MKRYQISKQVRVDNGLGFEGVAEELLLQEPPTKELALKEFEIYKDIFEEDMINDDCETHIEYTFYFLVEIDEDDNYTDLDWFVIGGNN